MCLDGKLSHANPKCTPNLPAERGPSSGRAARSPGRSPAAAAAPQYAHRARENSGERAAAAAAAIFLADASVKVSALHYGVQQCAAAGRRWTSCSKSLKTESSS